MDVVRTLGLAAEAYGRVLPDGTRIEHFLFPENFGIFVLQLHVLVHHTHFCN